MPILVKIGMDREKRITMRPGLTSHLAWKHIAYVLCGGILGVLAPTNG